MILYTFKKRGDVYDVGYYDINGTWVLHTTHETEKSAIFNAHILNGGHIFNAPQSLSSD